MNWKLCGKKWLWPIFKITQQYLRLRTVTNYKKSHSTEPASGPICEKFYGAFPKTVSTGDNDKKLQHGEIQ
jgi:hypothetical protein